MFEDAAMLHKLISLGTIIFLLGPPADCPVPALVTQLDSQEATPKVTEVPEAICMKSPDWEGTKSEYASDEHGCS